MPTAFLAPPANFVGRDDVVTRFKARLEHYNFFIYEGIPGIGKTALVRRLAKETKAVGVKQTAFLQLVPGEGVASVLARTEALVRGKAGEVKGDPFGRLIDLLTHEKVCLVVEGLQNMKREDLPPLVRALRGAKGPFRVLATSRGDPELSAMDLMLVTLERLGPLNVEEVRKLCKEYKLSAANLEIVLADAQRHGACGQPLTLKYLLALSDPKEPLPKAFLDTQSARSVNAFKALMALYEGKLAEPEKKALTLLASIGQPVSKAVAVKVFGASVTKLVQRGLIDEIEGDLYVHHLVGQVFSGGELSAKDAVAIAAHLKSRSIERSEPLAVIRAGKLLAQAGKPDDAVTTLADGWDAVRDLGFLEAYLKILASIPHQGALGARLQLLSARARMRQGNPLTVKDELERLSHEKDQWTKLRAQVSLANVYTMLDEPTKVVGAFETLKKLNAPPDMLLPVASLAAEAMLRLGKVTDAEKLAKGQLQKLKGNQEPLRQGELQRLLSQVYAQMGVLSQAVDAARLAAKFFSQAGDLHNAALMQGFIGDLYRDTGDFELAQAAFREFLALAHKWGDKNLVQIAELTEAWVSLDAGDVTTAQKRVAAVEKELSSTAGRKLRMYLATARALLASGRGHHGEAAELLSKVVDSWEQAGNLATADTMRAHLVRSLISIGKIDEASAIVDAALKRLDAKTAAPRVAAFLRESALIRLRKKDTKRALSELGQSVKLFSQGGNRREEALTLYRIAHAAFENGELTLAQERAKEALELAHKIKHTRVAALSRELLGRLALLRDDVREATSAAKEASQSLKRLGDEIASLHASEALLRAQVVAGDLAGALKLGPKVSEMAEALEVREVRIRSIALTGVALLKRERLDAALRCFREVPEGALQPQTAALMWRLGEALAATAGDKKEALARRDKWVLAIKRMPEHLQKLALHGLEQLGLPPRERYQLRTKSGTHLVGGEGVGFLNASEVQLYVDVSGPRLLAQGKALELPSGEVTKLLVQLVIAVPTGVPTEKLLRMVLPDVGEKIDKKTDTKFKAALRDLTKLLKVAGADIEQKGTTTKLVLPKTYMLIVPTQLLAGELSGEQKRILKLVRKLGSAPLATIEEQLKVERPVAKREVDALVKGGLLESVRDGRGMAFRLA